LDRHGDLRRPTVSEVGDGPSAWRPVVSIHKGFMMSLSWKEVASTLKLCKQFV
jgi:hypothetical protein